jgi:hypothetical protein
MKSDIYMVKGMVLAMCLLFSAGSINAQSYIIGAPSPAIGASASFTALIQFKLFDVLSPTGVIIDSVDIYPTSAIGSPFTIVVQNSSSTVIASWSGVTTVASGQPQRIKLNLLIPPGTGYRWGFSVNPGMTRNSTGGVYPYLVPGVMSITGNTFSAVYYYFFYNIRIMLPAIATDAGLSQFFSPSDSVCAGTQPVVASLYNHGPSTLTTTQVQWSVNNIPQTPYTWTGSLQVNDSAIVTIGTYNFATGTTYAIQAYTANPNNVADTINHNDTVMKTGIIVKTPPGATLVTQNTDICMGDTVVITGTLTGSPPWTVLVNDGVNNIMIPGIITPAVAFPQVPAATTTYTLVSVMDASGCTTLVGQSVTITVLLPPPAVITPGTTQNLCVGDSVVLMASIGLGFTYQWYKDGVLIPNATGFTYSAKTAGIYRVEVKSTIGCVNLSPPVTVTVNPLPVVSLGNDTAVYPGMTVLLNAGSGFATYLWSTGATTQTISVDSAGIGIGVKTIWVQVSDNFGCKGTDTIKINFTPGPGMDEFARNINFRISPNPSDGKIELSLIAFPAGEFLLEVFGQEGKKAYQGKLRFSDSNEKLSLDFSHLDNGIYFLKLTGDASSVTRKLIINR